jgi:hypothetical protein
MSRDKYTLTDAAAKRITMALHDAVQATGVYLNIPLIEQALRDDGFRGFTRNHIQALNGYWQERIEADDKKNFHSHMMATVSYCYVREYYDQREGIRDLTAGLQRLGVIPYPEEDA